MRARRTAAAAAAVAVLAVAGCSEAEDRVRDGVSAAVGDAAAVTTAEALAVAAREVAQRDRTGVAVRSVSVLRRAADELPAAVQVEGIEDADGDGLDDDGEVEVRVIDGAACLTLPADGTEGEATSGPC